MDDRELGLICGIGSAKDYSKDRVIFLEGDPFTGFYVVIGGQVKVYKLSADGEETILHMLTPYRSFAETPLLTGNDEFPACAQAVEDCILFHLPKAEFRRIMEESPSLALKLSEALASRLMELNRKLGQMSAGVETRLAQFFLSEITSNGSVDRTEPSFPLTTTKKDLASQLGMAIETLSRALRKLKDAGIIRESSGRIFVLDVPRLRKLAR